MGSLHFSLGFVGLLANHRGPILTDLFLAASAFGSTGFYVLIIMLVYVLWNKQLAVRLSFLVLLTMAFNDLLKNLIRNPRPYVEDGSYLNKWAVSPASARVLATEFSTPSGHAMASSAFYSYLFAVVKNRWVRAGAVLVIVLIGISRPYLGVHYGEDILLGWAIGIALALLAARYTPEMVAIWSGCPHPLQIALAIAVSMALSLIAVALNGWLIDGQLEGMATYAGFLTGNVLACPLELRMVNFDPRSAGIASKLARLCITAGMIALVLVLLKSASTAVAARFTVCWFALEYLRFAVAGFAGMFVAPWIFSRLKLVATLPAGTN